MLTKKQMEQNKLKFIEILNKCPRIKDSTLIDYLESTDFFKAPASKMFHNNCPGGLVDHSLKVYKILKEKCKRYQNNLSIENQRIIGLLHDLCKIDNYELGFKWKKDENNQWYQKQCWKSPNELPESFHGSKSIFIAMDYIRLDELEKLCIANHMGGSHYVKSIDYFKMASKYPEIVLTHHADYEASVFLENIYEEYIVRYD